MLNRILQTLKQLSLTLTVLAMVGCAGVTLPGAYLVKGKDKLEPVDPAQVNAQSFQYLLSPKDVLLLQIQTNETSGEKHKLEKGNQVRAVFTVQDGSKFQYRLVPGDELNLEFADDSENAYQVFVSADGKLTLPRLGKVLRVSGMSLDDLSKIAIKEYRSLYLDPKPIWSLARDFKDRIDKLTGDYDVGYDGELVVPSLGRFRVLGKTADEIESEFTRSATARFGNGVKASVIVPKINRRDQVDTRVSPSGLEIATNLNNLPTRVSEDGMLFVPNVGNVKVAGKTVEQARKEIAILVQANYQNPINVSLSVQEYADNSIFIGGEVRNPGRFAFSNKMSLLKLIATAGWGTENADLGNVMLLRQKADNEYVVYRTNLDEVILGSAQGGQDFKVTPQDIIVVPPSQITKSNRFVDQYIRRMLPFGTSVSYVYSTQGNVLR